MADRELNEFAAAVGMLRCYALISSRRGATHERMDADRQDRGLIADVAGDLVVLVADGAGSASHGAAAAEIAIRAALNVIVDARAIGWQVPVDDGTSPDRPEFWTARTASSGDYPPPAAAFDDWRVLLSSAMSSAREVLLHHASFVGDDRRDWATTLTIAVIAGESLHAAQIGDGFVIVWDDNAEDDGRIVAQPYNYGREAESAVAITSADALAEFTFGSAPFGPMAHLLVSSDGIAPVLLDQWSPLPSNSSFLRCLSQELAAGSLDSAELDSLLDSDLICSRSDDDKTVALVRRLPLGQSYSAEDEFADPAGSPAGRHWS